MAQTYELLFLTSLQDREADRTAIREQTVKVIQASGGSVVTTREVGRQRLAYPIKRQQAGEYALVEFTAAGPAVKEIERELRLLPTILRCLVTVKSEKARAVGAQIEVMERAKAREREAKAAVAERAAAVTAPIAEPTVIEDLDKKLEEILGKEMV
ncbi:30S ribosomal protein S6 [Candidatus Uhrbacteria bacterium]|nr:30S ribosomal protein S6 [Candidatus Uhrbacteria bacterium]